MVVGFGGNLQLAFCRKRSLMFTLYSCGNYICRLLFSISHKAGEHNEEKKKLISPQHCITLLRSFCLRAHLGLWGCLWGLKWGGREDCKQGHCVSRWETSAKAVMRMHNDSNKLDGARRGGGLSEKYDTEKSITPLFFFPTFVHFNIHPELWAEEKCLP